MTESLPTERRPFRARLFAPLDSAILVWLRIVAGVTIYFWAASYLKEVPYIVGGVETMMPLYKGVFQEPKFLFKYWGFEWVQLWPGDGIYWHFIVTKIAAVCLAVGLLTRVSAGIACLSIAYVLLVERQIYVNHYYLLSCVAGLLVFLPAGRRFAIDAVVGIERRDRWMPRWQLWLIRFQLGMPYVFGAIAKLNFDWFRGQPAGIILSRADVPLVDPYLTMPGAKEVISYGGFFFDLLIVPMLMYKPTRWLGIAFSLVFHLSNSQLLTIGVFPWFMLATLVVFFPPNTLPILLRNNRQPSGETNEARPAIRSPVANVGFGLAVAYVVVQLLLPLRPWILPGNPSWNERGQRFAWRMMLRNKDTLTAFLIRHPTSGQFLYVPSTVVMTPYQAGRAERDPELIRRAAIQLQRQAAGLGFPESEIHALALVSLNGRRPTPMIDPSIDLTLATRGWLSDDWVQQSPGPFLAETWAVDKEQWWQTLALPDPFKPLKQTTPGKLMRYVESLNQPSTSGNKKTSP